MPIQFRCPQCRRLLSISTKKSGAMIVCPACTEQIRVPEAPEIATAPTASPSPSPSPSPSQPTAPKPPTIPVPKEFAPLPKVERDLGPPPPESTPTPGFAPERKPLASETPRTAEPPRDVRSAYSASPKANRQPLFDEPEDEESHSDEDEHEEEHDEETTHEKKKFMDDTVDMTAMVDVTFLLLIFFMVTASFAAQKVFETSPPEQESEGVGGAPAATVEELESGSVVIEIDAADQLKVDDVPVASLFELRETLSSKLSLENKTEALIQAEYAATHGMVVTVTDAAMDVGMQKVRRVTRGTEE